MADFLLPLPQKYLLKRFEPVFARISSGHSASLLAFPQTGRTALLRFLLASPEILKRINRKLGNIKFSFIEIDKTGASFEAFLCEILINIKSDVDISKFLLSRDPYLLSLEISKQVQKLSTRSPVCFVITLNKTALPIFPEIDRLMVMIRRCQKDHPITILWSFDTTFFINYTAGHSASNLTENISYFKSFERSETIYNLRRFYNLKSKTVPRNFNKAAMAQTGGIAGLFHPLTNGALNSPLVTDIILEIKKDIDCLPKLVPLLLTPAAIKFIQSFKSSTVNFEAFMLNQNPTAQEIYLLRHFKTRQNLPVSRDEIGQILWGKNWESKYSDWAIDKTISRLRKKMTSKNHQIITVKNLGYELVSF